jgi:hypothetical protein
MEFVCLLHRKLHCEYRKPKPQNSVGSAQTAGYVTKKINKQEFEKAVLAYGISKACEYFNHRPDGGFATSLKAILRDKFK